MKKIIKLLVFLISILVFSSGVLVQGQEKKDTKKFKTTWKRVGKLASQKRSFKTEKAVTVAAVRGAEAEDEALKHLYWRGSTASPSRQELLNAISVLEESITEEPEAETVPESRFFIAQCYAELGNDEKAKENYNELIKKFPKSEFFESATKELEILKQKK